MSIDTLIQQSNGFSKLEIQETSEQLHQLFQVDETIRESLDTKVEVLGLYLDAWHKILYSDLMKENAQKVAIMKTIRKLKMQQEILELLQSEDVEEAVRNLKETAERFSKKAQSSVRKAS